MDNREFLLKLLEKYQGSDEVEENDRLRMIEFVRDNPECFDNFFKSGHITGSALVVDQNIEFTLLTHHSHLDRWFQFGGHSDSHSNPLEVAFREAQEESGLKSLKYFSGYEGIFDLDIHMIPERGEMPSHNHFDVRILLKADKGEDFVVSHESKDLKWVRLDEVNKYNQQPAFLRLIKKAKSLRI